jgi:predicted phosphodiesterase
VNVAALYDIHGMPWALEAVLADLGDVDAIVIGGDFVYGPYPAEALRQVRALDAYVLRGNCEREPGSLERESCTDEELDWAATLPLAVSVDGVLYCHATLTDDMPITTIATPDAVVAEHFSGISGTVVIGHTHHQFDRRVGDLRVVNAGAVGMPYENDVAAFWTLVEDGEPRPMRTSFDLERAVRAVRASRWEQAGSFVAENLLTAVDRQQAVAELEALR